MKKIFLTLAISLAAFLVFAFSAYATEYTVNSNENYASIYEQATDGDTITITSKLTCDIQATKSVTYILKADWESAKLVLADNAEVSFVADGGDYKIMPTNYSTEEGWMSIATAYTNVVINLGGINDGTLTIDGTNATHDRVSYVTATAPNITLNLLDGSAIANFNPETKDSDEKAFIIYARTINMYSGSKIYANCIVSAPLLRATYFNLFGGEIFGNVLESKRTSIGSGAIFVSERIMIYGGRIYKNIFNAKNTVQNNMIGFFTTPEGKNTVVLDVEIGDTYVTGNGSTEISAMFGTTGKNFNKANFYCSSGIKKGTRYKFTDTPVCAYDETTGKNIWQVSEFATLSTDWNGRSWAHTLYEGSKVAVFLDAQKKSIAGNNFDSYTVINAYIEGVYAYSGSTTIAVPSGYELWSTSNSEYCHDGKAYTLDEVNASLPIILYSAYNAQRVTVNGTTMCSGCGKAYTCNNPEHDLQIVSISYGKYTENGTKVLKCNTCGLEKATEATALPLFTCQGYSAPEDGRGGIAIGFTVNNKAIAEYEEVTGKSLKYGVFAVLQERLGDKAVFGDNGTPATGVINAEISSYSFVAFELKIIGFTDAQKAIKLAVGAYVAVTDGETTEYSYIQSGTPKEGESYCFVSYNDIVPTTSSEDEGVA